MAALPEEVKEFVVERLACYESPQRIADAVKEEFGIVIPRQQVVGYDPEKACKTKKWIDLHATVRQAFLDGKLSTAIERRGWRLRMIERMALRAEKSKNYKLAAELLEQAAKEEGGAYRAPQRVGVAANTPETDEDRVLRMRAAMEAMDLATVPPPTPTGPTLVTDAKAAVA
jgi:hypothetical protein